MGELRGLSVSEAKRRAGIVARAARARAMGEEPKVIDLSKGMQQKVQFATALIHEPELVILDEPWSGLDPINAEVLREIVDAIRAAGRTVLFSTHQMEQAEKVCDAVCIIARGKKVLDGNLARHQARVGRRRAGLARLRGRARQAHAPTAPSRTARWSRSSAQRGRVRRRRSEIARSSSPTGSRRNSCSNALVASRRRVAALRGRGADATSDLRRRRSARRPRSRSGAGGRSCVRRG